MGLAALGYLSKVTIGANKVLGIGTWAFTGLNRDEIDTSQFEDEWKQFAFGQITAPTISFSGFYDPEDASTLEAQQALYYNSALTDVRFWFDNKTTSGYFAPNQSDTTGANVGGLPANSPVGVCYISGYNPDTSLTDKMNIAFDGKFSGPIARFNADGTYWMGI
jgi:hypothetical protein